MIEIKDTNHNFFEKEFEVIIDKKSYFVKINYINYSRDIYYFRSIDFGNLPKEFEKEILNKLKLNFPTEYKITPFAKLK